MPEVWQLKTTARSVGQGCGRGVVSGVTGELCSDVVESRREADVTPLGARPESDVATVSQRLPALRAFPACLPPGLLPWEGPIPLGVSRRPQRAQSPCRGLPCPRRVGSMVWRLPQPGHLCPSHGVAWLFPPMLQGLVVTPAPPGPPHAPPLAQVWPHGRRPSSPWSSWHSAVGGDQTRALTLPVLPQETTKCPSFVGDTESKNPAGLTVLPLTLMTDCNVQPVT